MQGSYEVANILVIKYKKIIKIGSCIG